MLSEFQEKFPELAQKLGPQNLQRLLGFTTMTELPAGRRIIRDRMPVDSLYMLLSGQVAISVEEGGQSLNLGQLGPGEWLGEVSVLSGELLASSTVTTMVTTRFLRLRHQAFENLLNSDQEMGSVLLKYLVDMLAGRLRASMKSLSQLPKGPPATGTEPAKFTEQEMMHRTIQGFFGKTFGA
ncbi:MAG TPA: cyclic nucleotide-binding domain-containing protein [Stellaceae bacterium]|nr:cyclic nucleotide-binding domain-containing protein [Stellaceae bacterium]